MQKRRGASQVGWPVDGNDPRPGSECCGLHNNGDSEQQAPGSGAPGNPPIGF